MSRYGEQLSSEQQVLADLVAKAGPENLVGVRLYATLTLEGNRLYEILSYDSESQRFRARDVLTGREPSSVGSPLKEFEIGLATRSPEDPILQLLEHHQLPVTRFIRREVQPSQIPERQVHAGRSESPRRAEGSVRADGRGTERRSESRPRRSPERDLDARVESPLPSRIRPHRGDFVGRSPEREHGASSRTGSAPLVSDGTAEERGGRAARHRPPPLLRSPRLELGIVAADRAGAPDAAGRHVAAQKARGVRPVRGLGKPPCRAGLW